MTITTLSAIPYGNAKVLLMEDGRVILRSYQTDVAVIRADGFLIINGLYSATTRRHIGAFVKEYANINYQIAKRLYGDGYIYNIHTGELLPL